jgi:hypothetical protein
MLVQKCENFIYKCFIYSTGTRYFGKNLLTLSLDLDLDLNRLKGLHLIHIQ